MDGHRSLVDAPKTVKTKNRVSDSPDFTCPICLDPIKDATNDCAGEDAIVCEGRCSTWLHRRCAGLSKASYEAATGSSTPFFCPHCRLDSHEAEIASLKCVIKQLVEDMRSLGAKIPHKAEADTMEFSKDDNTSYSSKTTYAEVVKEQVDRSPFLRYRAQGLVLQAVLMLLPSSRTALPTEGTTLLSTELQSAQQEHLGLLEPPEIWRVLWAQSMSLIPV